MKFCESCRVGLASLFFLAVTAVAGSHPFTIKCPVDGQGMMFDHQVGWGKDAVCWYSHTVNDPQNVYRMVKHDAYIPCPD